MELNFIRFLEAELRDRPPPRKGMRTREKLKIAAARTLVEQGYHSLRLSDVSEAAGMAEGTIYAHFRDREGVINAVMTTWLEDFLRLHMEWRSPDAVPEAGASVFAAIQASTRHWFSVCRENKGMFRCVFEMSDDEPTFSAQVQQFNLRWTRKLTQSRVRREHGRDLEPPLLLTYAMKFMTNELVRRLIVFPDPMFIEAVHAVEGNDDLVADAASLIWLRTLYPEAPLPKLDPGPLMELVEWSMAAPVASESRSASKVRPPSSPRSDAMVD